MKNIEKLLTLSLLIVFVTSYANAQGMKFGDSMIQGKITSGTAKEQMIEYPLEQIKHGVLAHDVKCKAGFALILKSSDKSPACVRDSSATVLVMRGWASSDNSMKMMNQGIQDQQSIINHTMANETMNRGEGTVVNNMKNDSMVKANPGNHMKTPNDSSPISKATLDESKYQNAPALVGISDYINTTPAKLAQDIKGRVIVYDFWTFNCINCIHTLPHLVDLNNKYLSKGVLVIGIHSPETVFEKDPNNVRDAVHRYNIQYSVVIDNEFQTWNAFGNHYWPHIYIADAQGKIRYDHIGEGGYGEIDSTVASLLLEQENQKPKESVMG